MRLIDTHCHLDFPELAKDRASVLARAAAAGVARMITISTEVEKFPSILAIAESAENIFCSVGTHPNHAHEEREFSADELAHFVTHPERFIITHWLNPAYLIPVVEVSPGTATSAETTAAIRALLSGAGKIPVLCKPSPGFIVPRIQALAMNEAARMVSEGVASAEDLDAAIRYGFGLRFAVLGLIEFIDWGGGDILYHASRYLTEALGDQRYAAPPVIEANMHAGKLGMRSGQGFYDFSGVDVNAYRQERMAAFVALLKTFDLVRPPA